MFVIEDDIHAEWQDGEFETFEEAVAELERRAKIPWDEEPNRAPCQSWRTCGRVYSVIACGDDVLPGKERGPLYLLEIDATGVRWLGDES